MDKVLMSSFVSFFRGVAILKLKNAVDMVSQFKAKIRPANVSRLLAVGIETHYYENQLDVGMKDCFTLLAFDGR
jgi:hypothetical protein